MNRLSLPVAGLILSLTLLMSPGAWAAIPPVVAGRPVPSLAPMLERATPAVVNISTSKKSRLSRHPLLDDPFFRWFFEQSPQRPRSRETQSLGSGVIVDAHKGYVLTNNHVIDEADEIRVTLKDGRTFSARLLGRDPEMDIAVLQIPAQDLTALPWGDSDRLRVGDFVVAIGSPFGLNQTVTSGIVSALGRSGLGIEGYENFIQTDASINPGNSGGPLVDLNGHLVGINTAILAPGGGNVGIGFAIPANLARAVMRQIVQFGAVRRGVLGISVQDLNGDLARALDLDRPVGALVVEVAPGSAAERAGLRPGDVIVRIGDHEVGNASDLLSRLGVARIGQRLQLQILRNGKPRTIQVRIADPYEGYVKGETISPLLTGARLAETLDQSALGTRRGIAVGTVKADSPAWRAGLREGDVLFEVNGHRVRSLRELAALLPPGGRLWQIRLRRGDSLVTLVSR
ncbi:MAG: DegQ family serine endoprotease [Gammaproteobacteria bacterium]|nr:MAG: DegQ family serine endoprotease [Gammaproteobacteria bacterium]